jgi:hypothetical protein
MGEDVHPVSLVRAPYEIGNKKWLVTISSGFKKHAMNDNVYTLKITDRFLEGFLDSIYPCCLMFRGATRCAAALDAVEPVKGGWLQEIFPNLKRVKQYGYGVPSFEKVSLSWARACFQLSGSNVEVVLASSLALEPAQEVS